MTTSGSPRRRHSRPSPGSSLLRPVTAISRSDNSFNVILTFDVGGKTSDFIPPLHNHPPRPQSSLRDLRFLDCSRVKLITVSVSKY